VSDSDLIAALRRGDEAAFALLIDRYQTALLRVALLYVPSYAVAEEVVQETWLGVFQGIDRFEGRATLKTWIFRILTNRAKTRSAREESCVPFSALDADVDPYESAIDPARFNPPKHAAAGGWAASPHSWNQIPEHRLLAQETFAHIHAAVAALPASGSSPHIAPGWGYCTSSRQHQINRSKA
jgi:RNA polymerase sigma-70 factor (ECF subfamily)